MLAVLAISACLTLNLGTTSQPIAMMNTNPYDFGTQSIPVTAPLAFIPQGSTDDYYVLSVQAPAPGGACDQFTLSDPTNFGPATNSGTAHVYYSSTGTCDAITFGGKGSITGPVQCPYPFNATFTPSQNGFVSCDFTFAYMNAGTGSSSPYTVTLEGTGDVSGITATSSLSFTGVPLNSTSGSAYAYVQNVGSGTVTVNPPTLVGPDMANFTFSPSTGVTLTGIGSSAPYGVQCVTGSAATTYSAALQFTTTAGGSAMTMLSCMSQDTGGLTFSGDPVNFPTTIVKGTANPDQTMTAYYNSSTPTQITFTIDSNAVGNGVAGFGGGWSSNVYTANIGSGLPPVSVTLRWIPTVMTPGPLGTIQVALMGQTPVPVTINGDAEIASVATNPTSIDFGAVCAGNPANPIGVDIYNGGGADVAISGITLSQTGSAFSVQNKTGPLLHAHSNDVTTTVGLTAPSSGDLTAMVLVHLSDPDPAKDVLSIPVHATAVAAGTGVTANPAMLAFPTIQVATTSAPQTFVLANCGSSPLTIANHTFTDNSTGMPIADFAIMSPADPIAQIPAAASVPFTITETPQQPGTVDASLTLVYADSTPSTVVHLTGGGYSSTGSGGGKKNRQTYYACDAGRPGGFAPIALALLALRRRRPVSR